MARQRGDKHWTRRRKAAGLPAGNLNRPRRAATACPECGAAMQYDPACTVSDPPVRRGGERTHRVAPARLCTGCEHCEEVRDLSRLPQRDIALTLDLARIGHTRADVQAVQGWFRGRRTCEEWDALPAWVRMCAREVERRLGGVP